MPELRSRHIALYVHIPFCQRKCPYCPFVSHELRNVQEAESLIQAIHRHAGYHLQREPWREETVHSLFLGGGTPSLLSGRQVRELLDGLRTRFAFTSDAECTIEVNPGTLDDEKLLAWRDSGLNRISLGVQSLHDPTLNRLGRIHTAGQARSAYDKLRAKGFERLSVDLMYGIEVESALDGWSRTVDEVVTWAPDHISAYALTIEPDTPFAEADARGEKVKPDEDIEMSQYEFARERLTQAGYEHYEISNWARPGNRCRHNVSYWDGGSYLALGPAGHSYDATRAQRFWNEPDARKFMQMIGDGGDGVAGVEQLDAVQLYEERLALDLRMIDGAREEVLRTYAERAGKPWPPERLEEYIRLGVIVREDGRIRYTERGHHLADELEVQLAR